MRRGHHEPQRKSWTAHRTTDSRLSTAPASTNCSRARRWRMARRPSQSSSSRSISAKAASSSGVRSRGSGDMSTSHQGPASATRKGLRVAGSAATDRSASSMCWLGHPRSSDLFTAAVTADDDHRTDDKPFPRRSARHGSASSSLVGGGCSWVKDSGLGRVGAAGVTARLRPGVAARSGGPPAASVRPALGLRGVAVAVRPGPVVRTW